MHSRRRLAFCLPSSQRQTSNSATMDSAPPVSTEPHCLAEAGEMRLYSKQTKTSPPFRLPLVQEASQAVRVELGSKGKLGRGPEPSSLLRLVCPPMWPFGRVQWRQVAKTLCPKRRRPHVPKQPEPPVYLTENIQKDNKIKHSLIKFL